MCRWCADLAHHSSRVVRLAEIADDLRAEGYESDARKIDRVKMEAQRDVEVFKRWVDKEHKIPARRHSILERTSTIFALEA